MMHRALAAALLATALVACSKNTQPPPASQPAPANAPLPGESSDMAGQPANLAFTVTDMHGAKVSLASYKGRPLVVNFWATWCPPCKEEMPALVEAWHAARGRCLEMIGVTEESTREDARVEVARLGIPFPVVMDDDGSVGQTRPRTNPKAWKKSAEQNENGA